MRTVIIGLGNPVRSDDRVGLEVVSKLAERLEGRDDIRACQLYAGGLGLMEAMVGFRKAIIVDALLAEQGPGTIRRFGISELKQTRNSCSTHDASLAVALDLGRLADLALPDDIQVWGIEVQDTETIGESLTAQVARAVPEVVKGVLQEIEGGDRLPGELL